MDEVLAAKGGTTEGNRGVLLAEIPNRCIADERQIAPTLQICRCDSACPYTFPAQAATGAQGVASKPAPVCLLSRLQLALLRP